eukprot:1194803-Prorocentrum_minimum.AAC.2
MTREPSWMASAAAVPRARVAISSGKRPSPRERPAPQTVTVVTMSVALACGVVDGVDAKVAYSDGRRWS